MNVGFVGLGRMGLPMARALLRAGFSLTVQNRTVRRALLLGDQGATVVESPAEVAAACDVVITMLSDGQAVEDVMHGPDGLLSDPRAGLVLIEMSTIGPDAARELAATAAERRVSVLDAPVSGSVPAAESATLTTVVGGDKAVFTRVRPALAAMTREQIWLGSSGAGATMKLALNGMIAATNNALSEALVIAERSGIERDAAYEAIATSAVASPFVNYKRSAFLEPSDEPVAFTLELMQKDLSLYRTLARKLGVPLAIADASDEILTRARASQGDDVDLALVAEALRGSVGQRIEIAAGAER